MAHDEKVKQSSPQEVIEHIRRYEFGIGAILEGDGKQVRDNMVRRYRNLLATVAEDLNSKESHFILELLQNADDNHYAKGISPSLSFRLETSRLTITNNEEGFSEKNVRALCSAGESSKKNKTGYIGEKGIGFKSVFKVSDSPEIHSNGYHFKFNKTDPDDHLGYVVPHWQESHSTFPQDATTLVLPARTGHEFRPDTLADLNATLLIFLDKLREINVFAENTKICHRRSDNGPITTLSSVEEIAGDPAQEKTRTYFRARYALDMSKIAEPKREDIKTTDMVIAFPLSAAGEATPIPSCPTYAFLPIREFGFNFCIQADFVLISSREGIHEDLAWNVRLRNSIAPAFVSAVEHFKKLPALANSYLKFLPLDGDIPDLFFKPVIKQLLDALGHAECIPVESGGWRKPSEVLIASSAVQDLFPSKDAIEIFGADYPQVGFIAPSGALSRLSCRSLQVTDVLTVFGTHSSWFAGKELGWKAKFYAYVATSPSRDSFVATMLKLPCLLTAEGKMATPEKTTVFYPLNTKKKYGFEHELTILDGELLELAIELAPEVRDLFNSLKVQHDSPIDLIRSHILRRHTHEGIAQADKKALLGHVRYIRDRLGEYLTQATPAQTEEAALKALREGLFLGSKREEDGSWFFSRPAELYVSKEYKPTFNIEELLGDALAPGKLLSEKYILKPRSNTDKDRVAADLRQWHDFFIRIGVNTVPLVVRLPTADAICSVELQALLGAQDRSVRKATLECLDQHWSLLDQRTSFPVKVGRYLESRSTQFVRQLRSTIAPTKRRTSSLPLEQCFHDRSEIRAVLGDKLTFVDANIYDERFLQACGITFNVDATACLKRLRQIREAGGDTKGQIRNIYRRLESIWSSDHSTIASAFASEPFIAHGRGESTSWIMPSEACWRATNVPFLDSRYPALALQYVDHSNFFTKLLRVPLELPLEKWVDGLADLGSAAALDEPEKIALTIYRRLSRELGSSSSNGPLPAWLGRFENQRLFLNHHGVLVAHSPTLFFNDAPEFSALFEDAPGISLLAIPSDHYSAVANLLNKAKVSAISASMQVDVAPGVVGEISQHLTQKLRDMFMCIARVVYGQSHERFEVAVKDKLFESMKDLEVLTVSDLSLDVTLGSAKRRTSGDIARRGNQLLLRAEAPSHIDQVAMEVRKLLRLPMMLSDIISRLLMSPTVQDAEAYLQLRSISTLPPEEAAALSRGLASISPNNNDSDADLPLPNLTQQATPPEPSSAHTFPSPTVFAASSDDATLPLPTSPAGTETPISSDIGQSAAGIGIPKDHERREPEGSSTRPIAHSTTQTLDHNTASDIHSAQKATSSLSWQTRFASTPPDSPLPVDGVTFESETSSHTPPSEQAAAFTSHRMLDGRLRTGMHKATYRGKPRPMRTKKGRLLSYAEPLNDLAAATEANPELTKHKSAVEQSAVDHFIATASGLWRSLEVMPPGNPGFDIKALAHNGREEVIEVKGQSGPWTEEGVGLTPTELAKAYIMQDRYWLCVVEYATDENRRKLSLVRNPFGLTDQFRFDKGWRATAMTISAKPQRPEAGMLITIPGEGKGRILKVKGNAMLTKLHIEFEGGKQVFSKVFNPATMTLDFA